MSEDQERNQLGTPALEPDVEGHTFDVGRAEAGDAEGERREQDEPDVEGHKFETAKFEQLEP